MSSIIISADNEDDLKLIKKLARRLKLKTRKIPRDDESEEKELAKIIKEGRKSGYASSQEIKAKIEKKLKNK